MNWIGGGGGDGFDERPARFKKQGESCASIPSLEIEKGKQIEPKLQDRTKS
jgi:hypothetical protein